MPALDLLESKDKVIERCTKDEYSLFGSRLRSNRDSNGEYESFVQSSITISIVQMLFLSRFAKNRDRKRHPCDRPSSRTIRRCLCTTTPVQLSSRTGLRPTTTKKKKPDLDTMHEFNFFFSVLSWCVQPVPPV